MAITVIIEPTVDAVSGVDTQFTASGPFVLYGDGFAEGERCSLERLGPSGTYTKARSKKGMIKLGAYPNMVYVDAPGSYQLRKSATRTAASVGIQSSHTLELLINTDEYLGLKLAELLATRTKIVYDPQDLTTLFQDAAGTLPVYRPGTGQVDPPVGLMLDKSQGLELGPELWSEPFSMSKLDPGNGEAVYNTNTGEISVISTSTKPHEPRLFRSLSGLIDTRKFYRIHVKFSGYMDKLNSITFQSNSAIGQFSDGGVKGDVIRAAGGEFEWIGKPVDSTLYIWLNGLTTWGGLFIESISIREIKGYHAYRVTTTARPTLSGRYNLLTATETLATQSVTTEATDYTLSFSGAGTITLSGTATGTYSAGTHTITCTAGTLTCAVDGSVTEADLRVKRDGSDLPAYQAVADADNYDTEGFPLYLKRDKVDDVLTCIAPAITGSQGMGSTGSAVLGPVIVPAGEYTPLSESATTGIPEITRYVAIDGELTAPERAVVERYLLASSSGVLAKTTVFSFGLTSVDSFSFTLRTKADTAPVLVDWGDGTQSTHAGTTIQTASHTYTESGTYAVKVYGADQSVLTRFSTTAGGMSGALVLPSGMTSFACTGSNTLTGTLSLPAGMTNFSCSGSNTLTGTLSMPNGMTYFHCYGSNTLSGTLIMPSSMSIFDIAGSNTLTGTLSMPSGMTYFHCGGSNTLTGTLNLPSDITYFICTGSNTLSGYTPSVKASNQRRFHLTGLNTMSATDVDNILIDYDAAGGTWVSPKEITIQGNAEDRTSDSDAAYDSLAAKLTTLDVD